MRRGGTLGGYLACAARPDGAACRQRAAAASARAARRRFGGCRPDVERRRFTSRPQLPRATGHSLDCLRGGLAASDGGTLRVGSGAQPEGRPLGRGTRGPARLQLQLPHVRRVEAVLVRRLALQLLHLAQRGGDGHVRLAAHQLHQRRLLPARRRRREGALAVVRGRAGSGVASRAPWDVDWRVAVDAALHRLRPHATASTGVASAVRPAPSLRRKLVDLLHAMVCGAAFGRAASRWRRWKRGGWDDDRTRGRRCPLRRRHPHIDRLLVAPPVPDSVQVGLGGDGGRRSAVRSDRPSSDCIGGGGGQRG